MPKQNKDRTTKQKIISGVLIGLAFWGVFFLITVSFYHPMKNSIGELYLLGNYRLEAKHPCYKENETLDKVWCFHQEFKEKFEYKITKGINKDPLKDGGDCIDSAYWYCEKLTRIKGVECRVISFDNINHAINLVSFDGYYCLFDMETSYCVNTNGD